MDQLAILTELLETLKRDQRPIFSYEIKAAAGGVIAVEFENHRPYPAILRGATVKVTTEAPGDGPAFEGADYYPAVPRTLIIQGRPVNVAPPLKAPGSGSFWVYGIMHFANFPDGNDAIHPYRFCRRYDPAQQCFVYDPQTPPELVEH